MEISYKASNSTARIINDDSWIMFVRRSTKWLFSITKHVISWFAKPRRNISSEPDLLKVSNPHKLYSHINLLLTIWASPILERNSTVGPSASTCWTSGGSEELAGGLTTPLKSKTKQHDSMSIVHKLGPTVDARNCTRPYFSSLGALISCQRTPSTPRLVQLGLYTGCQHIQIYISYLPLSLRKLVPAFSRPQLVASVTRGDVATMHCVPKLIKKLILGSSLGGPNFFSVTCSSESSSCVDYRRIHSFTKCPHRRELSISTTSGEAL